MNKNPIDKPDIPDNRYGHIGELEMRSRLPSPIYRWDKYSLDSMIQREIASGMSRFISAQKFFFIGTSDSEGNCDATFFSTLKYQNPSPFPTCLILDNRKELIFPYFNDDMLKESIKNIKENPHIGMIFIDFIRIGRIRINGKAYLEEPSSEVKAIWPSCVGCVRVLVEHAYGNCPARIPKLYPTELIGNDVKEINQVYPLWEPSTFQSRKSDKIQLQQINFIESQSFFFIATANGDGHCDASFRGTEVDPRNGKKLPVAKVLEDGKTLIFPDYSGNALYNSLGNILLNPQISIVFVDFTRIGILKVTGQVSIEEINTDVKNIWPKAQAFLRINVKDVDASCGESISRMIPL
ncbi:pyridoxamine 5'-phosphate oxidase family protein [Acinetobacter baumannii]|nr:pyridoxamine 5'-phosphate oxidase family protein [Acinetobacter baumannii]